LEETLFIFGENGTAKAGGKSVNIIEEWYFKDNLDNQKKKKNVQKSRTRRGSEEKNDEGS
jgi:hypothetical protein